MPKEEGKTVCDIGLVSGNLITVFGDRNEVMSTLLVSQQNKALLISFEALMLSQEATDISINPNHVEFVGRTRKWHPIEVEPQDNEVNGKPMPSPERAWKKQLPHTLIIGEEE